MLDDQSTGNSEIAALAHRVATARGKLPLQTDPALFEELSEAEIAAERELAEWIRAQRRRQRRRAVAAELAAEKRDRRVALALRRSDDADARWHRKARAARRRVSNPDARLAQLYRRAEWSSRALIGVVVLGMVWAGVNVQRNLVPSGDMSDPLYWLSYGFEAMISIPIITIMVVATTAARWGREIARGKVVFLEVALLAVTIALNSGPHLAAHAPARAAEAAVAPVMVGVVIWLHAWVSARYAQLIEGAPVEDGLPTSAHSERIDAPMAIGDSETSSWALAPDARSAPSSTHNGYPHPAAASTTEHLYPASAPEPNGHPHPAATSSGITQPLPAPEHSGHLHPAASNGISQPFPAPEHNGHSHPAAASNGHLLPDSAPAHNGHPHPAADPTPDENPQPAQSSERDGYSRPTTEHNGHAYPAVSANGKAHSAPEHNGHGHPGADVVANGNAHPAPSSERNGHAHPVVSPNEHDPSEAASAEDHGSVADSTSDPGSSGKAPAPKQIRRPSDRKAGAEHPYTRRPAAPAARTDSDEERKTRTLDAIDRAAQLALDDVTDEPEPPIDDNDDIAAELDDVEVWAVAREISERGMSKLPVEQLAEVLTLADESWTPAAIGASIGLPGSRILGILEAARRIRRPYAISG
ncbi:hypothetical protein [Nocardia transvalensis]|uniref:hypothetical protein n=1 Tax=Nocardia transvalensis TaxID=37333 RepID=UPI001895B7F3|nr:hypothetical protein [Nocardia transvalensis]MBF6327594.1 hypothetical protein [Nocardia transvalensis]